MRNPQLSKYTEENFEAIGTLYGPIQPVFRELLYRLAMSGILVRITSAARSAAEQDALYRRGRPWLPGGTSGRKVTWVSGRNSMHVWGMAIDIVPLQKLGPITFKALWGRKDLFDQIGRTAADIGIAQPYPINDAGHLEYNQGLEQGVLSMVQSGYTNITPPLFTYAVKPEVLRRALTRLKNRGIIPKNA